MGKHTRMQTTQAGRPTHTAKRNTKTRKRLILNNVWAGFAYPKRCDVFFGRADPAPYGYMQKRALVLTKARFIKSGDDLLSHKHLQYHRPYVDKGD